MTFVSRGRSCGFSNFGLDHDGLLHKSSRDLRGLPGLINSTSWSLGMGNLQPLMTGILIMGPYKPLQTWVDEFIPYYMEIMGV